MTVSGFVAGGWVRGAAEEISPRPRPGGVVGTG